MRSEQIRLGLAVLLLLSASSVGAHAQSDDGASSEIMAPAQTEPEPDPDPAPEPTPPPATTTTTTTTQSSTIESTPTPRATTTTPRSSTTATTTTPTPTGRTSTAPVTPPEADEVEEADDGRDVDFIWIEVEGGVSTVNLVAFRNANFAGGDTDVFREVTGTGPMVGAAVGFRVYWLAVGARMSFASYDVFQIGTVGGDLQLRFPIPIIEPYIRVGAGYAWQGDANYSSPGMSATTVTGWSFDAALGFDIFVTNWLTLGAGAGLDLLNMTRQRDPTQMCMGLTDFCPQMDGDAVGFQLRGFAQAGLHF